MDEKSLDRLIDEAKDEGRRNSSAALAITAAAVGEWDHPALMEVGPLPSGIRDIVHAIVDHYQPTYLKMGLHLASKASHAAFSATVAEAADGQVLRWKFHRMPDVVAVMGPTDRVLSAIDDYSDALALLTCNPVGGMQ